MRSFIIYNAKYYLIDIYFIILLALVLLNLFAAAALPLQLPDFATFFVVTWRTPQRST
jgi:biopolymer transport protein ExbD